MACAAFVIYVFARMIVRWRVSTPMTTSFVFDALNQAIGSRRLTPSCLIHHSDRDMHYPPIRYAWRLAEVGINMPVGSVIGQFKTKVVKHRGPWKTVGQLEWETFKWVY